MPSESPLLPALLAQLRSPSSRSTTATASLTSSSADPDNDDDDDDETSSLEGLARRLNTARNAKRRVNRSSPPTDSLHRSDSASSSSAAAAASFSSSSTLDRRQRRRHARDDDQDDDAGKGAVKDDEEQADTDDDDDDDEEQDRVQFVSRSEGHPDPRDLLRAQLSAANTAATPRASSRTRRGDEILQSKQAQEQENPNPRPTRVAYSRRVGRDQHTQTSVAASFSTTSTSTTKKEEEGEGSTRSVSLQSAASSASSMSMRVVAEADSTSGDAADVAAATASEASSMMMYLRRRYFILSTAGKLVYTSDSSEEAATGLVGVMQAIVSIFADEGDKIRYIDVGQTKISFLLKAPLYLVVVSSQGEPEAVLRQHLDYLYLQVLSVVTVSQLQNIFAKRSNFDLRQLISGTEPFFDSLVSTLQTSLAVALSSISVYRLSPSLRSDLARALDPGKETIRDLDLLYVLLLAEGRLVTLLRPKKHSIHPTDLHLLLSTVYAPRRTATNETETETETEPGPPDEDEAGHTGGGGENSQQPRSRPRPPPRTRRRPSPLLEPGAESWFPICLPRFNPRGFLHAYVSFLETASTSPTSPRPTRPSSSFGPESRAAGVPTAAAAEDGIGVVILSSRRDAFVGVQQAAQAIKARLLSSSSSSSSSASTGGGVPGSASSTPHHRHPTATATTAASTTTNTHTAATSAPASTAADGGLVHSILMSRAQQSYSLGELAIPGLRHFVYKDRERVQVTMPRWEGEYTAAAAARGGGGDDEGGGGGDGDGEDGEGGEAVAAATRARMRLMTLYQRLHAALHPRTNSNGAAATVRGTGGREGPGGGGGASVQYLRTSHEAVLGWITADFELYLSTSPLLPAAAMVKCARRVSEWVQRDEARLFLSGKGAGVF